MPSAKAFCAERGVELGLAGRAVCLAMMIFCNATMFTCFTKAMHMSSSVRIPSRLSSRKKSIPPFHYVCNPWACNCRPREGDFSLHKRALDQSAVQNCGLRENQ